jgi:L-amino acid N-acyltransferase YncA
LNNGIGKEGVAMIVRPATLHDTPAMSALLNAIIRRGGTTAFEEEKAPEEVADWYLTGPHALLCHVAEDQGRIIGYQTVSRYGDLPPGWGDIGTFVDIGLQRSGAGAALFAATTQAARTKGLTTINATIRADNVPGLGYYARRGFTDYAADPDWALANGTIVGRISKRFDL